jgi:hypothetical protein
VDHQFAQQRRHLEHAAFGPALERRGLHASIVEERGVGVQVERADLGVLDHRDRVLDIGRDPQRARRRHQVGAMAGRHADDAVAGHRHLRPGVAVRLDAGAGRQPPQLAAQRARRRGRKGMRVQRRDAGAAAWHVLDRN